MDTAEKGKLKERGEEGGRERGREGERGRGEGERETIEYQVRHDLYYSWAHALHMMLDSQQT